MTKTTQVLELNHLAIILDGNRRWAKSHGLTKYEGHYRGYENLKKIINSSFDKGIMYFSAYVFSTENWRREAAEVKYLMALTYRLFKHDLKELHQKNVRVRIIGTKEGLSKRVIKVVDEVQELTQGNDGPTLMLCFNYGGHEEILSGVRDLIASGVKADAVTEEVLKQHLWSHDIPAPDMIVRTSGEQRLSNFWLWDSAYAELMFIDKSWPEFDETTLDGVIAEYQKRKRRFGA